MTATTRVLEPGVYRLSVNVTNPNPDRRRKGWQFAPEWKAGTTFHVSKSRHDFGGIECEYNVISQGGYDCLRTRSNDLGGDLLVEALEPASESAETVVRTFLLRHHEDARACHGYLVELVRAGIVTLEHLDAARRADEARYAEKEATS